MTLEYFNKLEDLMEREAPCSKFVVLYKECFNREPDENLIRNYNANIDNQVNYLENDYDDDDDDGYDYDDEPYNDED